MEVGDIVFKIDDFFTQTRVISCSNGKCKYNIRGECQLKDIYLNEYGMCSCKEVN